MVCQALTALLVSVVAAEGQNTQENTRTWNPAALLWNAAAHHRKPVYDAASNTVYHWAPEAVVPKSIFGRATEALTGPSAPPARNSMRGSNGNNSPELLHKFAGEVLKLARQIDWKLFLYAAPAELAVLWHWLTPRLDHPQTGSMQESVVVETQLSAPRDEVDLPAGGIQRFPWLLAMAAWWSSFFMLSALVCFAMKYRAVPRGQHPQAQRVHTVCLEDGMQPHASRVYTFGGNRAPDAQPSPSISKRELSLAITNALDAERGDKDSARPKTPKTSSMFNDLEKAGRPLILVTGAGQSQNNRVGYYIETYITQSDRPVYLSQKDEYMFYWEDYGEWRIGPDYKNSGAGLASCETTALTPVGVDKWWAWTDDRWHHADGIHVTRANEHLYDHMRPKEVMKRCESESDDMSSMASQADYPEIQFYNIEDNKVDMTDGPDGHHDMEACRSRSKSPLARWWREEDLAGESPRTSLALDRVQNSGTTSMVSSSDEIMQGRPGSKKGPRARGRVQELTQLFSADKVGQEVSKSRSMQRAVTERLPREKMNVFDR